jgi:hypothetical protein
MKSVIEIVETGWEMHLHSALRVDSSDLSIVCPFIKRAVIERLLNVRMPKRIRLITRFNLLDFMTGVSDTEALSLLLRSGAEVRGIRDLHAKLYLFGKSLAVVTSANLTGQGLSRNHELGFVSSDRSIVAACRRYFEDLWPLAGANLTESHLLEWQERLQENRASNHRPFWVKGLSDEGVEVPGKALAFVPAADLGQSFVKFFGISSDRVDRNCSIIDEVKRSGCHWACTYPKNKRPRGVREGAVLYLGRLVRNPNDIVVFGRAVAHAYQDGRDDASGDDIKARPWKDKWPHYIRVSDPEFISGILEDGISLNELMKSLGPNAFASTKLHKANGKGNIEPTRAYMQKAAVELSAEGFSWVTQRFEKRTKIPWAELKGLDWPNP